MDQYDFVKNREKLHEFIEDHDDEERPQQSTPPKEEKTKKNYKTAKAPASF